jgi:hypothetical protein
LVDPTSDGGRGFVETVVREVRIKIELPIKTAGLWHWATWLERHDPDYLRLLSADEDATSNPGWPYYWFCTSVIAPDRFRSIDVIPPVDAVISDERRQELLARSTRQSSLIDAMLGRNNVVSRNRVSTKPSKIRFR